MWDPQTKAILMWQRPLLHRVGDIVLTRSIVLATLLIAAPTSGLAMLSGFSRNVDQGR